VRAAHCRRRVSRERARGGRPCGNAEGSAGPGTRLARAKALSPAARKLAAGPRPKPRVETAVEARPFEDRDASGFTLRIGRADGECRPAYGAALGRRSGDILEVVLVVGDDEAAVAATAVRVARADFTR
jgi:hypothetical protein